MKVRGKICPICGDSKIKESAFNGIAEPDINFFLTKWDQPNKYFLTYSECQLCGLLFVDKYFDSRELSQLYTTLQDNNFIGHEESYHLTQEGYANFIKAKVQNKKGPLRVLEIGPDIGTVARLLTSACNIEKYDVIEGNSSVHEYLRQIDKLTIYNSAEDIESLPNYEYDVVVMIHVLDHIFDFSNFLKNVAKKLKPSGTLITCTHNSASVLAKVMGRLWPPICAHHPQIFSRQGLSKELSKNFRQIEIVGAYNYIDVFFPLRYFLQRFGMPKITLVPPKPIRLKLGNLIGCSEGPKND